MRSRALAILLYLLTATGLAAQCREDAVMLRGDWGEARFTVEIADNDSERAQGLMHRPSMPLSAGMLFIYERPQQLSFWMRNTLIPLDMLFIDPEGRVQHIHHRAVPLDETPIPGGDGLTHVLEINGGLAKRMGISEGSSVRHPSFDQGDAVWPC
ncbi:DUF192 domain-containing protein [Roseobacter sp.]|uniref:DUF192 domain-containing protein n=1 Tax=Roseobacter sp. TaxID=1907202 RepID=UPI0025E5BBAF|nr:DUF192 domain-containing protein [Roseobacter sp.]